MTELKKSTPIGRKTYLVRFIAAAERLGMTEEAAAERAELDEIKRREFQKADAALDGAIAGLTTMFYGRSAGRTYLRAVGRR